MQSPCNIGPQSSFEAMTALPRSDLESATGGWDATSYVQRSHDEAPENLLGSNDETIHRQAGFSGQPGVVGRPGPATSNQCRGLYMLPLEYTTSSDEPEVSFSLVECIYSR